MYMEYILTNECLNLLFDIWSLSVTLTPELFVRHSNGDYFPELYQNTRMHVEVTNRTWVLYSPPIVTLTLKQQIWVLCATHHPIMVNISIKLFCNTSKNEQDIDRTNPDSRTDGRTDARTQIHWKIRTIWRLRSSSLQAGSTKIISFNDSIKISISIFLHTRITKLIFVFLLET
jgi:hypothetical protein